MANPMATEVELALFYRGYYDKGNFGSDDAKASMDRFIRDIGSAASPDGNRELERFKAYYGIKHIPGGHFLDVGCGLGRSLVLASMLGFRVSETEMDADAVVFCKDRVPGADVRQGDLFQQGFKGDTFDFVLLYHVIEHLREPLSYLQGNISDPQAWWNALHRDAEPGCLGLSGTSVLDVPPRPDPVDCRWS